MNDEHNEQRQGPTLHLPRHWKLARLADIAEVQLGKTPGKSDYRNEGKYKVIKYRDLGDDGLLCWTNREKGFVVAARIEPLKLRTLQPGDVLVSASAHSSEIIGRKVLHVTALPDIFREVYFVGEILCIRTKHSVAPFLSRLLVYFFRSIDGYKSIQAKVHGVHLIASRAEEIPVPVPPLGEQSRVVSRIEELFSGIEEGERALQRAQKLVERYRQSVLKAAVTGELTRAWRERHKGKLESGEALLQRILEARREAWEKGELEKMNARGMKPVNNDWKNKYQEPRSPDATELPSLPEGWVWASLPQLGLFGRGKSKHRPRNDPKLYGGPYPFLQTGTIRASRGRITEYDSTYNDHGLAQSKLWPRGTVCITIAANIAASGILDFDGCFPDSVVGLVAANGVIPQYVEFFIRTARDSLDRYAPATAQKNINLEILEKVSVPLPPVAEQQEIFSKAQEELSKIDSVEQTLVAGLTRASALRQAVLRSAFRGELVSQDLDDEPAPILLERLAAERSGSTATKDKRIGKKKTIA